MTERNESFLEKIQRVSEESQAKFEQVKGTVDAARNSVNEVKSSLGLSVDRTPRAVKTNLNGDRRVKCMVNAVFHSRRVKIYSDGAVQVGFGPRAKLLGIDGSADIHSKTGVGRAAAGIGMVAVGALPLGMLLPSTRGDLMLSIVTDKKTHVIHTRNTYSHELKALRKITATGNAVISGIRALENRTQGFIQTNEAIDSNSSSNAPDSIATQVSDLAELHKAGVLTDEEFTSAKALLLGNAK